MLGPFESDLLASCQKELRRKQINVALCCCVIIIMFTACLHVPDMATRFSLFFIGSSAILLLGGFLNELFVAAQHVARLLTLSEENDEVDYQIIEDYKRGMKGQET